MFVSGKGILESDLVFRFVGGLLRSLLLAYDVLGMIRQNRDFTNQFQTIVSAKIVVT